MTQSDPEERDEQKIREILGRPADGPRVPPPVFVPEVGFRPASGGLRMAHRVLVEHGSARLTVHHLVSSGAGTELAVEISGLALKQHSGDEQSWMRDEVKLRDEQGREYGPMSKTWAAGGQSTPRGELTTVRRSMTLEPLDPQSRQVELRIDGSIGQWIAPIDLVPFDPGLAGTSLNTKVSLHGITISLQQVTFGSEATALDLNVVAEPPVRLVRGLGALFGMRRGPSRLVLQDSHGRLYEEIDAPTQRPRDPMGRVDVAQFVAVPPDAGTIELRVPYVIVEEAEGVADIDLPLTEPRALAFGPYPIRVLASGRVVRPPELPAHVAWDGLSLELDLGSWHGDRRLLMPGRVPVDGQDYGYRFGAVTPGVNEPAKHLEIPLSDPTSARRISFRYPTVQVRGPWTLRFPRGGS